jgi:hypothetical protein
VAGKCVARPREDAPSPTLLSEAAPIGLRTRTSIAEIARFCGLLLQHSYLGGTRAGRSTLRGQCPRVMQNSRANAFSGMNVTRELHSARFACILDEYVIELPPERHPSHMLSVSPKGVFWRREARSLEIQL